MTQFVPASTPVRRSRVGNIDTDRLSRRRGFVIELLADGANFEVRIEFAQRVAELAAIERELMQRGELAQPHLVGL